MADKIDIENALELFRMITEIVKPQSIEECVDLFTTCKVRVESDKTPQLRKGKSAVNQA